MTIDKTVFHAFIVTMCLIFTSCIPFNNLNERKIVLIIHPETGKTIECAEPPPERVFSRIYLQTKVFKSELQEIEKIISASPTLELIVGYKNIREIYVEMHAFEVMEYRLCRAYGIGMVDKMKYEEVYDLFSHLLKNISSVKVSNETQEREIQEEKQEEKKKGDENKELWKDDDGKEGELIGHQ